MLFVPTRIGRYEIKGRIGGGGMGTLYLARDTNPTTDRLVALKLLRTSFDSDDLRQRFVREAQSLAELNHPNIVTIHDSGEFEDSPFIVMEYVRGETVAESIKRRAPLSLGQKLGLLAELCAGLAHAHDAGIIHRDIKPANLMVDVNDRLKILDFGIARVLDADATVAGPLTQLNVQIGTPRYMSPEQIEGREIDARSDLFAVGAVAYEFISYREAFPGTTTRQIENKVLCEQPIPLATSIPGLDPEIADIIASALEKEVQRRCQDAATLRLAFERVHARLEEEEQVPRTTPLPRPRVESKSRHERAADVAYQRAMASHKEGADGFACRSAMEALAEDPQHAEARRLLAELGHLSDVELWVPVADGGPAARADGPSAGLGRATVAQSPADERSAPLKAASEPKPSERTVLWQAPSPPPADERTVLWQGPLPPAGAGAPAPPSTPISEPPPPTQAIPPPQPTAPAIHAPPAAPQAKSRPQAQAPVKPRSQRSGRTAFRLAIIVVAIVVVAGAAFATRVLWAPTTSELLTIKRPQGGTILSDEGIECGTQGAKCSVPSPRGATVQLRAVADAGFVFSGFTGDCASAGHSVVMAAARTCGATFSRSGPLEYLLTVERPAGGTIEGAGIRCGALGSDCSIDVRAGVQVALTAEPESGFTFGGFTGNCAPAGVTVMTEPRRCGATFSPVAAPPAVEYALTISKPIGGTIFGPGIKCGAAGSQCESRHPDGFSVALTQQADHGYKFAAFTGDCMASGRTRMVAARRCGATFVADSPAPPKPVLTIVLTIVRPIGGTIVGTGINCGTAGTQCSAEQAQGSSVILKAQPDPGFKFVAFTGACDSKGLAVMATSRSCGATFAAAPGQAPPPLAREWFTNLINTRAIVTRADATNITVSFIGDSEFAGYTAVLKATGQTFAGEARRPGCESPSHVTLSASSGGVFVGQFMLRACNGATVSKTSLVLGEKR